MQPCYFTCCSCIACSTLCNNLVKDYTCTCCHTCHSTRLHGTSKTDPGEILQSEDSQVNASQHHCSELAAHSYTIKQDSGHCAVFRFLSVSRAHICGRSVVAMLGVPALLHTAADTAFCWNCTCPSAAAASDAYTATALAASRTR